MRFPRTIASLLPSARCQRHLSTSTTANPSEIAHFSRLSRYWCGDGADNAQGEFALLHRMNPVRVSFIQDKMREIALEDAEQGELEGMLEGKELQGMHALDVGCGGGLLSEVTP
jgi:polyprenyldihydroxybenzoate methyltransferase/3-demethylubiquinol 3-O-methyltransferase